MTGDDASKTHPVSNPAYDALVTLHGAVVAAQDELGNALKSGGTAWTGPSTATTFTSDIGGRSQRLPSLVDQIPHAVEDTMAHTDKTVQVANAPASGHPAPQ